MGEELIVLKLIILKNKVNKLMILALVSIYISKDSFKKNFNFGN